MQELQQSAGRETDEVFTRHWYGPHHEIGHSYNLNGKVLLTFCKSKSDSMDS